ncbi:glycosyltransferase family A protein [Flavivirga algicola]|uniref:Glycosyltransferase family 2 protein n=1 Tax=Flavivirga algicola TaxID=2729136 RepID=A0ABX1RV78_9FLAO|nr:glycosyltransferase family A protein [Flavivirga algicola]NMH86347.1 glycosyltransferase family 2 protein [Flavivirga algicola]
MRIGTNPEKLQNILEIDSYHRVVIPVYIPNLTEDYFKDALKIFKLCFESLQKTIHSKTRISIINNGCCDEVLNYLTKIYNVHENVDQLLNSKINLGKVNALYSAIKSNLEPLITITDSDVMFLPEWQQKVENILEAFPESGMVSPVPSSIAYKGEFLYSTIYYALTKGKLQFTNVKHPDGLEKFEKSIGRQLYNQTHKEKYLTVTSKKEKAVLGCGHFVATFKADVFNHAPKENCKLKIVGGSENNYLDKPNDKGGFLRLATHGNYAYHLGNIFEPWMEDKMNEINKETHSNELLNTLPISKPYNKFQYTIGKTWHIIFFKKLKSFYFGIKGVKKPF